MNKVGIYKLSKKVSKKLNNSISQSLLQDCFKIIINQMSDSLLLNNCVNIENFGIFIPSFTKARSVNFLNKEIKNIAEQKTIKFIPHNTLIKTIKRRYQKLI